MHRGGRRGGGSQLVLGEVVGELVVDVCAGSVVSFAVVVVPYGARVVDAVRL